MDEALVRKLRVPASGDIAVFQAPEGFHERIGRTLEETTPDEGKYGKYAYVQMFATNAAEAAELAPEALRAVNPDGLLWLCYPKGTSKIKTDLNRDRGWEPVKAAGWEGIALVSVDDTWSAMRFRPAAAVRTRPAAAERGTATDAALDVPADLRDALDAHPSAAAFFEKLAPSHRKEYIMWIVEAKRDETRLARIGKTISKLADGLKRPSDK